MTYPPQRKHAVLMFWTVDVLPPVMTTGCGHKHRNFDDAEKCQARGGWGTVTLRAIGSDGSVTINAPAVANPFSVESRSDDFS